MPAHLRRERLVIIRVPSCNRKLLPRNIGRLQFKSSRYIRNNGNKFTTDRDRVR
jgi:hypothetical protein